MNSIKQSLFQDEILKELHYSFGSFYLFHGFIVSEINEGIDFSWKHGEIFIKDALSFYNSDGKDIVYISHRIHKYNVKPVDWLKFTSYALKLRGYAIVVDNALETRNAKFESLFVPSKFRVFDNCLEAVQWAATINEDVISKAI
ncbi:MAG: hypothetical protein ABF274_00105 [Nonlabens sp.]|uniref:hypothetical protein n=1 Tax=Nonlabens sp. TaxID=1888209 RepID=UPI00321BBC39